MEGGERQLELGLDPGDLRDLAIGGLVGAVAHQGGLPHPCLTPDDQHRALTAADTAEGAVDLVAFA